MLTPCKDIKPFGGGYMGFCKISDGHKYICVDKLLEDVKNQRVWFVQAYGAKIWICNTFIPLKKFQCLIYSFGINNDWSFESTVAALGK